MKKLIVIAVMLFPLWAFGQHVDTRGLTKEQIAELTIAANKMKTPEGVSASVRKEATAWADLGANIGSAMVSAAKEVGVAANEFSQTSLGKIVTVIIVYKVIGRDILGVVVGGAILLFGFGVLTWLLLTHRFGEVKYEYRPMLWGMWQRRVVTEYAIDSDSAWAKTVFSILVLIVTLLVGLKCIF